MTGITVLVVFFFSIVNVFIDIRHVFHPEVAMVLNLEANVPRDADDRDLLPVNLRGFFSVRLDASLVKRFQLSVHDLKHLVWIFQFHGWSSFLFLKYG